METSNSSKLTKRRLTPSDNNVFYECRASNSYGNFSFKWLLQQHEEKRSAPPSIFGVVNATASVGDSAQIVCNIVMNDVLLDGTIWLNGSYKQIMNESNMTITMDNIPQLVKLHPELKVLVDGGNVQQLHFESVTEQDFGPYTCYYTNERGHSAEIVWLLRAPVKEPVTNNNLVVILVSTIIPTIIVIVAVGFFGWFYYRRLPRFKPVKKRVIVMTNSSLYHADNGFQDYSIQIEPTASARKTHRDTVTTSVAKSVYQIDPDPVWEIPREKIKLGKPIGDGNIGYVLSGKLLNYFAEKSRDVAIKMLRDDATDEDLKQLFEEMMTLKQVGVHPNVISFLGCCTQKGPVMVVVELARHGNLRDFLRRHRPYEPETDYVLPSPGVTLNVDWTAASMTSSYSRQNSGDDGTNLMEDKFVLTYRVLIPSLPPPPPKRKK